MDRRNILLLIASLAAATGSLTNPRSKKNHASYSHSLEGPVRPGAFVSPDGELVMIEAGDVGLYETGMFDFGIDYKKDVRFILYTTENPSEGQQLYLNNLTSINQSNFNASRPTKFVIHGFLNDLESPAIQDIKDAFVKNYNFNVIAVAWGSLALDILYPIVVSEVPGVGKYVGEFIEFLVTNASVNASQVHLIGHSLGAHVAGFAGKHMQSAGHNVSRISGLDPALPGYALDNPKKRLAKTDADYVDCIHTCSGIYGFASAICQTDFYPNGGYDPQPGCFIIDLGICSHLRAFRLYAASINETNVFSAEKCDFLLFGIHLGCSKDGARMGYPATEKDQGKFYLKTTGKYPYAEST